MRLFFSILCIFLCFLLGDYLISLDYFSNTPVGQLTINQIGEGFLKIILIPLLIFASVRLLFGSLAHDKIWPWRWTTRYFLVITSKAIFIGFFFALGKIIFHNNFSWDWRLLFLMAIFAFVSFGVLVFPEEEFYKEYLAPTFTPERVEKICKKAERFRISLFSVLSRIVRNPS